MLGSLLRRSTFWQYIRQTRHCCRATVSTVFISYAKAWSNQSCNRIFYDSGSRKIHVSSSLLGQLYTFNLPDVGERIATVELKEWLVKVGDAVSMGDPICEVQSDKSAATVYCPYDGIIKEIIIQENETAYLDKPLVVLETDAEIHEYGSSVEPEEESVEALPDIPQTSSKVLATPAVRRVARENNVNLPDVKGTGKDGRILKEDIFNHIELMKSPSVAGPITPLSTSQSPLPPPPPPLPFSPPPTISTEDRAEPITGFKAVMVHTMTESGRIPQFGYKDEVNASELVRLRSILKDQMATKGVPFSYMPILIKAVSLALNHYPILNSTVDQACTAITYRADHNVGVAMDTSQGLIVPNIKAVQNKTVFEIAVELNRLYTLGKSGQLSPNDIADVTFSLSNIGAIGGTYADPLLLPPSVAIGAFGKIKVVPMFSAEEELQKAHMMHVSWSADHRVIDGAEVARFSNVWKSYIENPALMILET